MMDLVRVQELLSSKPAASEERPFGPETLVFKVGGKMFALAGWTESPLRITLKCEPLQAEALRASFPAIQPGYYMNKAHWNTITLDGSVPDSLVEEMINASYALVVKALPKAKRAALS
jgi:predicted DNA-binding protein (MmcQ/YjbR family)